MGNVKKINIRRMIYLLRHKYMTLNNGVIVIALMIAAGWAWGSLGVMQRNYNLQKELDDKKRSLIVSELDVANEKLEQRFYNTDEYKELAVRERLGLGLSGESVLILPANSDAAKKFDSKTASQVSTETKKSNFEQWMNFLFGANSKHVVN